jgi:hypothetical protein
MAAMICRYQRNRVFEGVFIPCGGDGILVPETADFTSLPTYESEQIYSIRLQALSAWFASTGETHGKAYLSDLRLGMGACHWL